MCANIMPRDGRVFKEEQSRASGVFHAGGRPRHRTHNTQPSLQATTMYTICTSLPQLDNHSSYNTVANQTSHHAYDEHNNDISSQSTNPSPIQPYSDPGWSTQFLKQSFVLTGSPTQLQEIQRGNQLLSLSLPRLDLRRVGIPTLPTHLFQIELVGIKVKWMQ